MGEHDSLGLSGRPGGVDEVGQPGRIDPLLERGHGLPGHPIPIEGLVEHHGCARVPQDVIDPLRRVGGVERQVGGAGLEDPEQEDGKARVTGSADPDHRLRAQAQRKQVMGQLVGGLLQLGVGEAAVGGDHGQAVRGFMRLLTDQLVQAGARHLHSRTPAPLPHLFRLRRLGQREGADRLRWVGGDRLQQDAEAPCHPLHGLGLEEVGAVLQEAADSAVAVIRERKHHVELAAARVDRVEVDLERAHRPVGRAGIGVGQGDLEERAAREVAARVEAVDQEIEGQVLVGERLVAALAAKGQDGGEGGAWIDLAADGQGVGQESDHSFQLRAPAVGDRSADHQVGLPAEASEEDRPGGE